MYAKTQVRPDIVIAKSTPSWQVVARTALVRGAPSLRITSLAILLWVSRSICSRGFAANHPDLALNHHLDRHQRSFLWAGWLESSSHAGSWRQRYLSKLTLSTCRAAERCLFAHGVSCTFHLSQSCPYARTDRQRWIQVIWLRVNEFWRGGTRDQGPSEGLG